jgi:predicted DNA-binding transcriptional regulator AlpA
MPIHPTQALTERETAHVLKLSRSTLRAWRRAERGPRFVRFGRAVRYLESDVAEYVGKCAGRAWTPEPRSGRRSPPEDQARSAAGAHVDSPS